MELRQCGKSGLNLSVIGAGCWAFGGGKYWGDLNQKDADEVVRCSVELGINYFDTAEAYNDGRSEEALGRAIKDLPREKIVVGTKVSPSNCEPATLIEHCESSLRRLNTDYIDLYMIHWPVHSRSIRHFTDDETIINNPPQIEDSFAALEKLQQQKKNRYIGVSNFAKPALKQAQSFGIDITANELPYNLLARAIECQALPYCRKTGVGIIGYMTLLQGLLADIYSTLDDVPAWQRRTRHFNYKSCKLCRHGEEGAEPETEQALARIRSIAVENGMTIPEIAVKWATANQAITCALIGTRNIRKLRANVKAVSKPLPNEIVDKLNSAAKPLMQKLGPGFDYYENTKNDRTVI